MKLILHRMFKCKLCTEIATLLHRWDIPFTPVYDKPEQDRPYPYLTIELEYEEIMDWVSREKLQ